MVTVRTDDHGDFDEMYASACSAHLEVMSRRSASLILRTDDGAVWSVQLRATKRGRLRIVCEEWEKANNGTETGRICPELPIAGSGSSAAGANGQNG